MSDSIAILVLNYNGRMHLDTCLTSVLEQVEKTDQVYLVDNGSIDGSIDHVRKHYPTVKVIDFQDNLGFALAYNRAAAVVPEEYVIFLNNDVEVGENWLSQFKLALKHSSRNTIYGSEILLFDKRNIINHGGGSLTVIGAGFDSDYMQKHKAVEKVHFVGCVSGASMLIGRQAFLDLGGFDQDFFAYFEDVDLCWRAWLEGFRVLILPSSLVYHKLSSTMGPPLTPERIFLGEKNRLQAMLKNLELQNIIAGLFASSVYCLIRVTYLLHMRKVRAVFAIMRGDLWVLRNITRIIAKRKAVQRTRKYSDRFLYKHGLMIGLIDGLRAFIRLTMLVYV